jgi:hypothetical protein
MRCDEFFSASLGDSTGAIGDGGGCALGAAGVVGPGSFLLEVLVGILDLLVKRHGTHFLMENVLERRGKAEWKREACL